MFIHRIDEGGERHIGLNWMSDERSFLSISLIIPIYLIPAKKYTDSFTENVYYGWQVKLISFYFRIRRWKSFPVKVKKVLYDFNLYVKAFGSQQLIATREMLKDGRCQ